MMSRLVAASLFLCMAAGAQSNWRGWDQYQVIMWSTGAPLNTPDWIARLREIGFTAEQRTRGNSPLQYVANNFGFYVENLVSELAFLHSREGLYTNDFDGYTSTRDKKYLLRKPCFHDPQFIDDSRRNLLSDIAQYVPYNPLLYDLRDELSIGRYANPMDYCYDPHTLAAFRQWLQQQYGSLASLNQEWRTSFSSWDQVVPLTTYEIKDRERADLASGTPENYAPWSDFRSFMDLTFAQTLDRLRNVIREADPVTPVGIEGTQMPSAWGGYDLWRLSQAIDWVEAYDIANSREVFRSFLPAGTPILSTVFGADMPRIQRRLWWLLLHGDRGAIVWDDDSSRSIEKTAQGMPLTDRGRGLQQIFADIKATAPKLIPLQRLNDPIAIHYSQASIEAHWMFDSREDRDTWPRRFSSYEATHSRLARVRDSFVRVVEDLGLQYKFVSSEQIENNELIDGGYRVLLLPQSVAMSAKECRRIEAFVRGGGLLIADNMTATMDEHLRRLQAGQLDDLFGIQRSSVGWSGQPAGEALPPTTEGAAQLRAYEPGIKVTAGRARYVTSSGTPAVIESRPGYGRTVYLNIGMHDYGRLRLTPPQGAEYTRLFGKLLEESGFKASVKVQDTNGQPVPCTEVWRYTDGAANYVAVMRNPEFSVSSLQSVGYPDNSALEQTARVRIVLPGSRHVTNVRTGSDLGVASQVDEDLDPWSPIILKLERLDTDTTRSAPRAPRPRVPAPRR
jgi:hypothetical protein